MGVRLAIYSEEEREMRSSAEIGVVTSGNGEEEITGPRVNSSGKGQIPGRRART